MYKRNPELFGISPVLPVRDVRTSMAFYIKKLGFAPDFVIGEPPSHGSVSRGMVGIQFTLAPADFIATAYPVWMYVFVEKIDLLYAEFQSADMEITKPLNSNDQAMREFEIRDMNGFRIRFGQYLASPAAAA